MAEPIQIQVEFTGAQEAARAADTVSTRLDNMSNRTESASAAAQRLAAQQTAAATAAIAFGQRLAAASNAIQGVTSALGIEGQAAGLIGKITQTSVAMAQLGASFGPQGELVGGIIGAAIPAIGAIVESIDGLNERNAAWAEQLRGIEEGQQRAEAATRASTQAIDDQAEALANAGERMRQFIDSLSTGGIQRQAQDSAARITELSDQLARVNDELAGMGGARGADAAARMLGLQERARELTAQIQSTTDTLEESRRLLSEEPPPRAARGGGRAAAREEGAPSGPSEAERMYAEMLAEENAYLESQADLTRYLMGLREEAMQQQEQAADRADMLAEREKERQEEIKNQLIEGADKQREVHQQQVEGYKAVAGVIVGGLNDALQSIISGQKSAEDAFKGMLSSFLKFISEQSMLKAIYEFAEAIASFASQDYVGGAQHVAAGVAFTAVAVATGAGAVAVAQPSGAAAGEKKPASPEAGAAGNGRGGGDVVINWNSPVVTAGTRAELGRDMASMIRAGSQRFGTV